MTWLIRLQKARFEAGRSAALYALGKLPPAKRYTVKTAGENVRYVETHHIGPNKLTENRILLQMRV